MVFSLFINLKSYEFLIASIGFFLAILLTGKNEDKNATAKLTANINIICLIPIFKIVINIP